MEFIGWDEWQVKEWALCRYDIIYFVETYVWVFEKETARIIPFNMLPYRQLILEELAAGHSVVVDKCRRAGASWTAETFAAWETNFIPGSSILNLSKREKDAFSLLDKHRFVLEHLALKDHDDWQKATKADWLCGPIETDAKGVYSVAWYDSNGNLKQTSESNSLSTTKESGRSEGAGTFIFDEFGFVKPDDRATWRAARPSIMRGGKYACISTPNGVGGVYYELVMKARRAKQRGELDKLGFTYIEVDWWDTEITQAMYDSITAEMSEADIRQEFGREFLSSGTPAFDHTMVTAAYKPIEDNPWLQDYFDEYHERVLDPEDPAQYVIGVDTAKGRGGRRASQNYLTVFTLDGIQVTSLYNKESVANWAGNLVQTGDGTQVWVSGTTTNVHEKYPGMMIVEANLVGDQVLTYHQVPQDGKSQLISWETTHQSKGWLVFNGRKAFEGKRIILTCQHTYEQVLNYQDLGGGKYDAPDGEEFYDDPVIGVLLAIEGINQINPISPESITGAIILGTYLPSMTGQMTRDTDLSNLPYGPMSVANPYKSVRQVDLIDPGKKMPVPKMGLIDGL